MPHLPSPQTAAILLTVGLSLVAVGGDYFLKLASGKSSPFLSKSFILGVLTHAAAAFGWVIAMKHLKMAYVAVFYSVPIIVLLAVVGYFAFGEKLNSKELLGIALAIASIVLLARIA